MKKPNGGYCIRATGVSFPKSCCSLSHMETCHHLERDRVSGLLSPDGHGEVSLHFARWSVKPQTRGAKTYMRCERFALFGDDTGCHGKKKEKCRTDMFK